MGSAGSAAFCPFQDIDAYNFDNSLTSWAQPECAADLLDWTSKDPVDWIAPVTHPPKQSTAPGLRCKYHGCKSGTFQAMCDLKLHHKEHSSQVLAKWKEGQPCGWPKCHSKAVFKSPRMLQTHLDNIHVNPLLCSVKSCTHKFPFRSNYDLKRHMRTVHSAAQGMLFVCPYLECEKEPKEFVRKDKWLNHLRTCHESDTCPLNHCDAGKRDGLLSQVEIVEHIQKCHGYYECGLGSCSLQPQSKFAEFELLKHLELKHGVPFGDLGAARNAAKLASDRTVRSKDVTDCVDCVCCERLVKQAADVGGKDASQMTTGGGHQHTFAYA